MSHVEFKNCPCRMSLRSPCRMSNLRIAHVAVSNLRNGRVAVSNLVVQTHKGLKSLLKKVKEGHAHTRSLCQVVNGQLFCFLEVVMSELSEHIDLHREQAIMVV